MVTCRPWRTVALGIGCSYYVAVHFLCVCAGLCVLVVVNGLGYAWPPLGHEYSWVFLLRFWYFFPISGLPMA